MIKFIILFCAVLYCGFIMVVGVSETGPGKYLIKFLEQCVEESEECYEIKFNTSQHKINRTHDGFDIIMELDTPLSDEYAIRIDICKQVDGGCKPFHVLSDNSLPNFAYQYAKENVKTFLELANCDPPDFPVPKGEHKGIGYIVNYDELPKNGPYGEFYATCYIIKNTKKVGCLKINVEFNEKQEGGDDEDDYE